MARSSFLAEVTFKTEPKSLFSFYLFAVKMLLTTFTGFTFRSYQKVYKLNALIRSTLSTFFYFR